MTTTSDATQFAKKIRDGLAQIGLRYVTKEGIEQKVKTPMVVIDRRYVAIGVNVGELPQGIKIDHLVDPKTVRHLGVVCGHPVNVSLDDLPDWLRTKPERDKGRNVRVRQGLTYLIDLAPEATVKAKRYSVPAKINYQIGYPHRFGNFPLGIPLGLDASGEKPSIDAHVWMPLPKLLHVMVVGMTGGGKSNYLHTVAGSLFAFHSPREIQACLIDGAGGAAFGVWENIPHLIAPLAVNLAEAVQRLGIVKEEVERREQMLHHAGFNLDIDKYNRIPGVAPMPPIWLAIDECGTLADEAKATGNHAFTDLLGMIAKRARKTGIYIWMGAQNPTADVIPTGIKGQVTNIAFRIKLAPTARMVGIADAVNITIPGRCLTDYWGQPREVQTYYMPDEMLNLLHKLALKWERTTAMHQPSPGGWMTEDDVKVCVAALRLFARQLETGEWVYPFPINGIIDKERGIGNKSEGGVAQSWLKKRAKDDLAPQGFLDITNDDGTPGYVMTPKLLAALEDALTRPNMRAVADAVNAKIEKKRQ